MSLMDHIVDLLWIAAKSRGPLMLQLGILLKLLHYENAYYGLYVDVFDVSTHRWPITWLHRMKGQIFLLDYQFFSLTMLFKFHYSNTKHGILCPKTLISRYVSLIRNYKIERLILSYVHSLTHVIALNKTTIELLKWTNMKFLIILEHIQLQVFNVNNQNFQCKCHSFD